MYNAAAIELIVSLAAGLAAMAEDIVRRRISNWTSGLTFLAGLLCHARETGARGVGLAISGAALGFAVFFVFFLLGGMGGGDVKLMAGFGSVLGPSHILLAALLAATAGGIMAAGCLLFRLRRRHAQPPGGDSTIPYAPAITLGVWLVAISRL